MHHLRHPFRRECERMDIAPDACLETQFGRLEHIACGAVLRADRDDVFPNEVEDGERDFKGSRGDDEFPVWSEDGKTVFERSGSVGC